MRPSYYMGVDLSTASNNFYKRNIVMAALETVPVHAALFLARLSACCQTAGICYSDKMTIAFPHCLPQETPPSRTVSGFNAIVKYSTKAPSFISNAQYVTDWFFFVNSIELSFKKCSRLFFLFPEFHKFSQFILSFNELRNILKKHRQFFPERFQDQSRNLLHLRMRAACNPQSKEMPPLP